MSQEPGPLRNGNFMLYFSGVVLSEMGLRGTLAINLYHVYLLTGSTTQVGLVGLFQFVALVLLAPLGGAIADRLDRRRLVQCTQGLSFLVSAGLAALTLTEMVQPWHIFGSVLLNNAAASFDSPARWALIPGIVPRHQLAKAFALVNPGRELAWLGGPAIGGFLVAAGGPGLMYAVDAVTFAVLVVVIAIVRVAPLQQQPERPSLLRSIGEGLAFVRSRSIVWQLLALDMLTMLFGAWRVILPALAEDVLQVGPTGYGWLVAAVPAGALCASLLVYLRVDRWPTGKVVLWATAAYGLGCLALAQSRLFAVALVAGLVVGAADALWSTLQQAAIQAETGDEIRGRVSSLHQLAARGGPAIGNANIGMIAGFVGPVGALSLGALVPIAAVATFAAFSRQLRHYKVPTAAP